LGPGLILLATAVGPLPTSIRNPLRARPAGVIGAAGFTLVEVLVVVLIIGIMLTFATLSVGDRAAADTLDTEARRIEQLFRLAQEESELKGYEIGFLHTQEDYQFLVVNNDGRWMPIAEGPLRPRQVPQLLSLRLRVDGRPVPPAQQNAADGAQGDAPPPEPQVLILSSGEFTAFALDLEAAGLPGGYRLSGTLLGRLELDRYDEGGPT
jgi:general secretion pathway protein H